MRTVFLALFALVSLPAFAQSTRELSLRYLEQDSALAFDSVRTLLDPDMTFWDPTGNVFQNEFSGQPLIGAESFLEVQKGWGLEEIQFVPDVSMFVGEYALHRGTYSARFSGEPEWTHIPFVTVHRVRDGRLVERIDFGEYIQSFGLGDRFDDNTTWTEVVADQYLDAYTGGDIETQAVIMADDVVFQDPTAQVFGPPSGQLFEGKESLLARRKQIYQNVGSFSLDVASKFYANNHAVYMGHVEYTAGGREYRQPAVFVVEVRNQRVTRHWDFVDYSVGASN